MKIYSLKFIGSPHKKQYPKDAALLLLLFALSEHDKAANLGISREELLADFRAESHIS
ncbi:hypothetical protein [Pantoea sp.]|uniref:hypothetical protein n=1 Tax=Pantoea sp. TaxID=69393 RepID=UPI0031D4FD62